MPAIALDSAVPSPQAAVAPRLLTVLGGYAARDDVVLTLDLGLAGAEMSVPVSVEVGDAGSRTPTVVPISLRASRHTGWFPVFRGEVGNDAAGPLESILRLNGTYEAPFGPLGGMADRTVLGHAAERSLRSFLERLRSDVLDEVRRSELDVRRRHG